MPVKPALALLASPLLGPGVWQPVAKALAQKGWPSLVCAATAPVATPQDALDAFGQALPPEQDVVLVPHSNAGAYVPALVSRRRVIGVVFVDAVLPPNEGLVPLAPPSLRDFLRGRVHADGQLPGWTQWWDESDVATLLPDAAMRARVEREQPRLPLSYFEGSLPVPSGWNDIPGAYLAFGDTYAEERDQAARKGWPVTALPPGHLRLMTHPTEVASQLAALVEQLGLSASSQPFA
jgi:hypothetical protein